MNMTAPQGAEPSQPSASFWRAHSARGPRYVVLFALLAGALIAVIWLYRDCVEVVTTSAAGEVSSEVTCGPPTMSSGPLLLALLLVLALLWPDLADVTVLGVGLTRKIEAAKNAAEVARDRVELLEQSIQVQDLRIQSLTSSSASNYTVLSFDGRFLNSERAEEIRGLAAVAAQDGATDEVKPVPDNPADSDAQLKLSVIDGWERLSTILGFASWKRRGGALEASLESDTGFGVQAVEEFIEDNERSIQLVRDLRNSVAHARDVDHATLAAGARLLDHLLKKAQDQLVST